jgi:hypothetical protein
MTWLENPMSGLWVVDNLKWSAEHCSARRVNLDRSGRALLGAPIIFNQMHHYRLWQKGALFNFPYLYS